MRHRPNGYLDGVPSLLRDTELSYICTEALAPRKGWIVMTLADVDPRWLGSLRRYVLASAGLHLVWEILQLPLYTIWWEPFSKQSFAVLHCTAGDVMIASLSLLSAPVLIGKPDWPQSGSRRV